MQQQSEFRRRFTVDGLVYDFTAVEGGPVTFRIVGGATKAKAFTGGLWIAFDEELVPLTDNGYHRHAAPVLARVSVLLTEWVRSDRPFGFHFRATDDRKHRIYQRMVEKCSPLFQGYTHFVDGDEFWFVRQDDVYLTRGSGISPTYNF